MKVNFRINAGPEISHTKIASQIVRIGWWDLLRALFHSRLHVEVEAIVSHSSDVVGLSVQVAEWWRDPPIRERRRPPAAKEVTQ